jgi:hypothetical protein
MLGEQLAPNLTSDGREVQFALFDHNGTVQSQQLGLVGRDICDVI